MQREKFLEILVKELKEKVPTRSDCNKLTQCEIYSYSTRIDFAKFLIFYDQQDLKITVDEISESLTFQLVLYLSMLNTIFRNSIELSDKRIWNLADYKTSEKYEEIRRCMKLENVQQNISRLDVDFVFTYAISSKMNF